METDAGAAASGQRQALPRRLARIAAWLGGIALLLALLDLIGVPASDWIRDLFDKVAEVPAWAIASGVLLESAQTSLAALAWLGILRAALPRSALPFRLVLASYAVAVALNGFLPANLGTFVMLVMFTTLIAGATFPLVISGLIVEKIPFSVFNLALYLYLFLTVSGSFSIKLGFLADHTALVLLLAVGAIALLVLLARVFWERLAKLREQLVAGGAILRTPRRALTRLALPRPRQLPGAPRDRRRLPRRIRDSGQLPERRHRHRLELDLQQRLGHPGRRRRHPGDELRRPFGLGVGEDRNRVLDRPAADRHRLGRDLRDRPGLLGLRLVRRQAAGRVLLRGGEGEEPRDALEAKEHLSAVFQTGQSASSIPQPVPADRATTPGDDLNDVLVTEREHWPDGPPHALFKQLRHGCPVHWTSEISEFPESAGYWSVTTADDVHEVSRDWQAYSSERGGVTLITEFFPIELARAMFIGMDPPKHDRVKALFQAGFTPKRIAAHEEAIRKIVTGTLDRIEGRETCDLVSDVAQPAVARVIGSFMGIPPEDDAIWAELMNSTLGASDPDLNPHGIEGAIEKNVPEIFKRCGTLIAARRESPTDDLTSVLVHAEVDGEKLEEHEIVMGFFLLVAAGNDSTKATYCSGMRALIEDPEQRQLLIDDPTLIPGAVEEALRMFPAFAHFRRTATRDTELHGQQIKEGDKVVLWYASSNRDESRYEDPDRFDVLRNPDHQAFGAGGRHFCLGTALARLELRILLEETLARYPNMELEGKPKFAESAFLNQLKTLPVRLSP